MKLIVKDNEKGALLRFTGKSLLVPLACAVLNVFLGISAFVSLAVAVVVVLFSLLAFRGRNNWGDRIEISSHTLRVLRGEAVRANIPASTLTAKSVRADALLVAWNDGQGKRKSLVVGREVFTPASWQELSAALSAFGA
jgi:hypothetical protein